MQSHNMVGLVNIYVYIMFLWRFITILHLLFNLFVQVKLPTTASLFFHLLRHTSFSSLATPATSIMSPQNYEYTVRTAPKSGRKAMTRKLAKRGVSAPTSYGSSLLTRLNTSRIPKSLQIPHPIPCHRDLPLPRPPAWRRWSLRMDSSYTNILPTLYHASNMAPDVLGPTSLPFMSAASAIS